MTIATTKAKSAAEQKRLDRESKLILHQGASLGHLALMFEMDKRTVSKKLTAGGVEPCGERAGFPIYKVKDAAPYLVPPKGDFEEAIKNMHHEDIPPLLHKNYWQGKRERQRFEEENGLLVNVHQTAETVATVFKAARMSILLMPDAIEREFALTDEQREAMKRLVDGTLEEVRKRLVETISALEVEPDLIEEEDDDYGDVFEDAEADEAEELGEEFDGL